MTAATRCPRCAARLHPDDAWCGQCHVDLRPAPACPPPEIPAGPAAAVRDDPAAASVALADRWAERLAQSERGSGLPRRPSLTSTRGGRAGFAAGVGLAVLAVLLLAMAVAGAFL